jgi:microcompartment protein CcmK/EutM
LRKRCAVALGNAFGIDLMQIGRVIGSVVCTIKSDALEGKKLLLVQPLDRELREKGRAIVAVDSVGAGTGELIYWCRGKEASFPWPEQEVPTEASIVGIVDQLHLG